MKISALRISLLLWICLLGSALHAGNPGGHDHAPRHLPEPDGKIKFVENQGQWDAHIRYAADIPGGRVFVEADRLTFHLADLSGLHDAYFHAEGHRDHRPIEIRGHAFQLVFPQAQASARIVPAAAYPEYHNYFIGDDPSRWRGGVPLYGQLRYEELWPGIDLVLYGREGSIKYDLIVHPGHDTRAIALQYAGVDAPQVQADGRLRVPTALGPLYDAAPVAFQGQSAAVVPSRFECEGQTLRFGFAGPNGAWSSYQNTGDEDFIIDPSLVFGSYTGSTADNFGFTATYDTAGNLYGGGIVFGVGYPTTLGAFQTTYGGGGASHFGNGFDISISKFNPTGTALVYSTYLGGSLNEQPHSLITNDDGELMVYGRSNSLNYPTTAGAAQTVNGGNSDIIVTKFNAAGSALIGSTYLGGSGEDGLNVHVNFFRSGLYHNYGDDARGEIMIDASGNIYIASCTQSANFPTSPGAFQAAFGGGIQDGCVVKFNSNLTTRIWSTYLGGNAHDAAYSVKVDGSGSAYVTGGTESANFPTTAGTVSPASNGSTEGFITRLNPAGSALVASTFVGTSSYDQCFFLELDASGSVYVFGQTEGAFPVSPGVYSNPGSGQFIAKYNGLLTTTAFSTVFGTGSGSIDISPTAFLVDICGFIYVSGWGGSVNFSGTTSGLPTTANAFQSVTDGSDIYLLVLQPDAAGLEYATFYGGGTSSEHVDGGTSRFDKELVVYQAVCAGCGGNDDFPTTPGAVSATNNSFNCNLGVFKFAFDAQFVEADYTAIALDSCAPFPVVFTNASTGALSYFWDFGDGSTSTLFSPSHTFVNPGTYTVTLIAIDSNSCNVADTAIATVTVYANPIIIINQSDTACAGDAVQLLASGGQFYSWSPAATLSNPNIAAPIAHPTVNTTYSVIVSDTNGCVDTATVDIYVTFFNADAGPPVAFCEGTGGAQLQAGLINGGLAPYYYIWTCDTTNTFCGLDSVFDDNPVANPTQTTMYYLQVQDSRGCLSELDSALVEVLPNPIADAGPDQYICQAPSPGALLHGTIYGAPGPYTFYWIQSTGLNDSTILNPFARPDTTTIYTLVAVSSNGCTSNPTTVDTTSTVTVHVHPRPIADAGPTIHSCFGDTVMIQGLGYGAGPDYDFEWSPFTGLSDSSINNPHGSPPITTTYTLTVWSNGCPSYGDTMTLWVHTLPTPSAGNIVEICLGDSGQFDAFGAGDSSAYYTYQWTPPLGLNDPTLENPLASPDTTTTYFLEVTSSWGCKSPLDSVLLRVKPTPIAEAGPNLIICAGDSIVLPGSYHYATTDSAPPSQIYYSWTPALTLDDSTLAQPLAFPGGSTVYQLQVFHNTCVTADSLLVTVVPGLGATAASDTSTICGGDSVRLTAIGGGGGASILWTPATGLDDPTSFTPMAAPGDSITYTATLSEGGCIEAIPVQLNVIPRPTAAFIGSDDQGCPPHPVHFLNTSDAATAYVWNFGDGTPVSNFPDPTHTFTTPGTYTVLLTALVQGACADTAAPMTIIVGDTAVVDFMSDPAFPAQLSLPSAHIDFTNLTVNGLSYVWDFGDGTQSTLLNPDHSYASPGEYYVRLIARSGSDCPGSVVHGPYVVVLPDLYIPNVFSPNGDGINDLFRPDYTGDQPFSFGVYDRWGHPLYITQNKVAAWDGRTTMGDPVPEGVFFYRVRVADKDYVGELTLLR